MNVALGSDQAKDPTDASPHQSDEGSEVLHRLIGTRAQIIAIMRDTRLPPLAKQVGCLLWAITQTWEDGGSQVVTWAQLAENIRWESSRTGATETASAEGVRKAISALRKAGYVVVESVQHPGNVKPARVASVAREVGAPLTVDLRGPFRVWTRVLLEESPGSWGPGLSGSEQEVPGPGNREYAGDGLQEPGVGEVPGPRNRPKKENSQKKTLQEKRNFLAPPPPRGGAAEDHLGAVSWDDLSSAEEVVDFLAKALTPDGQQEVRKRNKRFEIERGIRTLLGQGWEIPRVVVGLGLWVGDRTLRNSDVLEEIAARLVRAELAAQGKLVLHRPIDVLRFGFQLGTEVRQEREAGRSD